MEDVRKNELVHTVEKKETLGGKQPQKIVVSLWLDNYDNIFSDFDPRSYSHRALSDDFLVEARKVTREIAPGVLDVTFLIPHAVRDISQEKIIKERLHAHFRKHAQMLEDECRAEVKRGIFLIIGGVIATMAATTFSLFSEQSFINHFFRVALEPAGWFCTWTGLDLIFNREKSERLELQFNKKMAKAEIDFDTYKL